jgi:glycosyltransferase involved in cell wall biosynthesis
MRGELPPEYRGKLWRHEQIEGINHYWSAAAGNVHKSFRRRALNYVTFAATSSARGVALKRPDVIWASSPPLSIGGVGRLLSRRFRRPWIFEVRDLWPESAASMGMLNEHSRAYKTLLRFAKNYATHADAMIVPTPGLVDMVKEHGATDVTLVTGAITDNAPESGVRERVRAELGIPEGACLFVYAGAHGVVNGLDKLLDAAKDLDPTKARVVLAGDGSAREALEQQLAREPNPALTMLGTIPKDDVPGLLAASDVCLHLLAPDPLFKSALPTKVLEYFGSHRAFITTVPGLPEQLANESGGGFAGDTHALRDELERWVAMTPAERADRGEQAFAFGMERYGLAAIVDTLEELLTRVARR